MPELVEDGRTGWVLPAESPEAWGELLALLAADPQRVASAARALPEGRSGQAMTDDFLALYSEVLGL